MGKFQALDKRPKFWAFPGLGLTMVWIETLGNHNGAVLGLEFPKNLPSTHFYVMSGLSSFTTLFPPIHKEEEKGWPFCWLGLHPPPHTQGKEKKLQVCRYVHKHIFLAFHQNFD